MAMPTFHPAALLRDPRKRPVWEDIQQVMAAHKKIVASRQAGHQEKLIQKFS